ncbi:prepilin peptidase [Isoptericola sediminis]|uniref:Prepilin peptidase n=1 Tax=Isoptericola sediminis TaxID=2733572 RepID=A0A849K7S5_9MICO|nr:A24 family peptidase [Isoptericola sediminis]NNU27247.1 prepilin peptidase [Isoptericola sediminis]
MTHPLTVTVAALACALLAGLLTPWARRYLLSESRLLRPWVTGPLAGLGGAGAAVVTTSWAELVAVGTVAVAAGLLIPGDLATYRLPDRIVGPAAVGLVGGLVVAAAVADDWSRLLQAVLAGVVLLAVYLVLAMISPSSLGFGDVKLAGLLGTVLGWWGWQAVAFGTLAAFVLFAVAALVLLAARRTSLRDDLPFGPAMILGAALGLALLVP